MDKTLASDDLISAYKVIRSVKEKEPADIAIKETINHPVVFNNELNVEDEHIGHLAAIVESSSDAIISKSLTGIIRTWNKGGERMFGYTAQEVIGRDISLIIPKEYIDEEKKILQKISDNKIIDHYETVRTKKNGERVNVSLTISPIKDSRGTIIGVSKIARDITARKQSEMELILANKELAFQNSEKEKRAAELLIANEELAFQNYEKVKRATELGILNEELAAQNARRAKQVSDYKYALDESSILSITDDKGVITYVNEKFCTISGYSSEELIGQDHCILNSGYHSKEFMRDIWDTIAAGKIWKGEIKNKTKDGAVFWVDTTMVPFMNDKGIPYQYAALRADITLRKLAEEKVETLNEELEQRVKERTQDLESFSYSVSHDLRAPLRAMNGYARMFKGKYEGKFDQEASRLITNIVDNTTRMGQLMDDLLSFFRVGRRELNKLNVPMFEIVTNICQELKKDHAHRDIDFNIQQLLPVKADNTGIKQVWLNLISNAVKYSRLKNKSIIEIGSQMEGNETVYYVKDNGAGFDMQYVSKLFNIFQRLHSEDEFEGTGVGLAIVHRIISKHGGRVWATSILGEEATFYFSVKS